MIFNPLFLGDNSNSQLMTNKQEKLSNNKYLFSDIVKVVMNPLLDSQNKSLHNPDQNVEDLSVTMADGKVPVRMHLKFLSDLNIELSEEELTDLLPSEISKLIEIEPDSETQAVSYISKDLLDGELKSFVNNLIGNEIIQSNINNDTGLLLSLEDSQSAVNIELSKSSLNSENKIEVQTVVIPHKEKLFSLLNNDSNSSHLFRYKKNEVVALSGSKDIKTKPSLSLYAFNNKNQDLERFSKLINMNSQNAQTASLKPISMQLLSMTADENMKLNNVGEIKTPLRDRTSINTQNANSQQNEYEVNKITIFKKSADNKSEATRAIRNTNNLNGTSKSDLEALNRGNVIRQNIFKLNSLTGENGKKEFNEIKHLVNNKVDQENKNKISEESSNLKLVNNVKDKNSNDENNLDRKVSFRKEMNSEKLPTNKSDQTEKNINENNKQTVKTVDSKYSNISHLIKTDGNKVFNPKYDLPENSKSVSKESVDEIKQVERQNNISTETSNKVHETSKNSDKGLSLPQNDESSMKERSNDKTEIDPKDSKPNNVEPNNNGANSDGKASSEDKSMNTGGQNNLNNVNSMQVDESEKSFSQLLNKDEKIASSFLKEVPSEIEQSKTQKYVKSVEIVRELSKYISNRENGSISFHIKPEHLGQLKITLDTIDNLLKARIEVDNEQAKQMLEKNLDKLHHELNENGVKLNSLNISLGNQKKQKEERLTKEKNQSQSKTLGQVGESEEENQKKSLGYNTYEYIA